MSNTEYKILLIEDDKLDQTAFMRMVKEKELPYDCTVAASVSEALSILAKKQFDIIMADYMLGDGTAFDILNSVKNIPVIIVTGAGDEEIAVRAWKAGAHDYLIKDHERNYLKTVSITVENTLRLKRAEEKLRLLSHAITSTNDSVYITNMENKIIFVNKAFCETYGYSEEEIIGQDFSIFCAGATNACRAVSGWETGVWHKQKDGSEFPVSVVESAVKDENGKEIAHLGVARDISELVLVECRLRAINTELRTGNKPLY